MPFSGAAFARNLEHQHAPLDMFSLSFVDPSICLPIYWYLLVHMSALIFFVCSDLCEFLDVEFVDTSLQCMY